MRFLRGIALERQVAGLEKAAESYWLEVLEWTRFCTLFPYPGGGDIEGQAALDEAAGYIRRALVHERVAVDHLRQVINAQP